MCIRDRYHNNTVDILAKKRITDEDWEQIRLEMSNICNANSKMASMQIEVQAVSYTHLI